MKKLILASIMTLSVVTSVQAELVACKVTKSVAKYTNEKIHTPYTVEREIHTPYTVEREVAVKNRVRCGYTYQRQTTTHHYGSNQHGIGGDTLMGATMGGLIGNQFGSGSGKTLATGVGILLGGSVANSHRTPPSSSTSTSYVKVPKYCTETSYVTRSSTEYRYETRLVTRYKYETVKKLVGYTNYFRYLGVLYVKDSVEPLKTVMVSSDE